MQSFTLNRFFIHRSFCFIFYFYLPLFLSNLLCKHLQSLLIGKLSFQENVIQNQYSNRKILTHVKKIDQSSNLFSSSSWHNHLDFYLLVSCSFDVLMTIHSFCILFLFEIIAVYDFCLVQRSFL